MLPLYLFMFDEYIRFLGRWQVHRWFDKISVNKIYA